MNPLAARVVLVAILLGSLALAGCTDKLSFSGGASVDEPDFTLEPASGGKDTVFRVDAGSLGKHNVTWDWGDGVLTYGGESEHKYGFTNGRMTVTLIVTADDGAQGFVTKEIVLGSGENKPPTASVRVSPRAWVEVGKSLTLTASGSDPDRDPLTYLWTYEEIGSDFTGPATVIPGTARTNNVVFDEPGRYVVKVRAKDPKGGEALANATVDVSRHIPSNRFEAVFNGTIRAGTAGAGASEKLWIAPPPAPDTEVDALRHPYTLEYPATTIVVLQWNDTSNAGAFDLDLEVRNDKNETVFKSETHAVNPASPGVPTPLPPFEFNVTDQPPGAYWVIVRGYTGVDVKYTLAVHATLRITPELVAAAEVRNGGAA